jgi:hypothetical protein
MDDFSTARKTSVDHALCFRRYAPQHNYLYHDVYWPVTSALRSIRFHVVILDTTALCVRYSRPRDLFYEQKERYRFLAESDAIRIAFPQDDYDHSSVLDTWLSEYWTDIVYSVVSEHRELLYPRMMLQGEVVDALTGYVDNADVEGQAAFVRPFAGRDVDLGYRAKFLPANFGRYGQLKGLLADQVRAIAATHGLTADVSTRPEDVLVGGDWLKFLGNSRWCPGAEGGSSVWDPNGTIMDKVREFVAGRPQAGFDEIEAACFPGLDGRHVFSAVSPRLFEAALTRTGQILKQGRYLDVLQPGREYLPLEELSTEVIRQIRDVSIWTRLVEACYEALIATKRFRYSQHVARVFGRVEELICARHVSGSADWTFKILSRRHLACVAAARRFPAMTRASGLWRRLGPLSADLKRRVMSRTGK